MSKNKINKDLITIPRRFGILPVLDYYIFREFMVYLSILLLVFITLFILGDVFNDLGDFLSHGASLNSIIGYLLLKLPGNIRFVLPISVLLGCMWTMAMFGKNMEVTAMRASGISLFRCGGSIFIVGLIVTTVNIWFNEGLVPYTEREAEILKLASTKNKGKTLDFQKMLTYRSPDKRRTWLFRTFNVNGEQEYITLKNYRKDETLQWDINARSAKYIPGKGWIFSHVIYTPYSLDGLMPKSSQSFKEMVKSTADIGETPEDIMNAVKSEEELPTWVLWNIVAKTKNMAARIKAIYMSLFYYRLAFPWSCFLAVFLGIPLATKNERSGIVMAIITAVALIITYIVVSQIFLLLGKKGILPPIIAGLLPTLAFIGFGWYSVAKNRN
ncbi:LptF/LptG family permease [Lentisphaerota bacterium ZTH]|nr:LptF/LptG family permease [Lentisphaerota bacterium]WET06846.1 LptF/LptG family permease [Lentisphaerota bacterium ZTH]